MTRRATLRSAFSLIELMLVMAILAIALAMMVPTLHGFGTGRRVEHTANQMVALARWARTQAITQGVAFRFNLDPAQGTYWLTVENNGSVNNSNSTVDSIGQDWGRIFNIPPGVTVSWDATQYSDGRYVRIDSTGRTDPVDIQVSDNQGDQKLVACYTPAEQLHVVSEQEQQNGT